MNKGNYSVNNLKSSDSSTKNRKNPTILAAKLTENEKKHIGFLNSTTTVKKSMGRGGVSGTTGSIDFNATGAMPVGKTKKISDMATTQS